MATSGLQIKVNDFLNQKRIAVIGVSRDRSHHPVGNLIYQRLKKTGHEVFAVNPNIQTFDGGHCYPNVQSIPGGVDGAVVITKPEITEKVVRDCSDAGVHRVWIHEGMPRNATSVSAEAVEFCRKHDINVIAGACPMMYGPKADLGHRCMRWILNVTGKLPT